MILIFSRYAFGSIVGGVESRVKSIDEFFADHKRIYIDFRSNTAKIVTHTVSDKITTIQCRLFRHLPYIILLLWRSDVVYCHTLGYAFRILPFFLFKKVIVDFHGAGPEEALVLTGSRFRYFVLRIFEYLACRLSYRVVVVTERLFSHFEKLYGLQRDKTFIIPILPPPWVEPEENLFLRRYTVYSGSLHKWQMIDFMLHSIAKSKTPYPILLLTGETQDMQVKVNCLATEVQEKIYITTVCREQLDDYYKQSILGFVLRDESVINKVACPTKLVDYINNGIIPVMYSRQIGDFGDILSISIEEYINGTLPNEDELQRIRAHNHYVFQAIYNKCRINIQALQRAVDSCCNRRKKCNQMV
ncbi:Hypothetical protein LUCI_0559 [Lucifera butyrica]|uniref:Glycosyltransferase subfamily 4-like N-terminal domain-containing protein n=1 Tax=Lucifera butyrica TaxID=1351585 RepID=A0A498R3G9_9FIRM|nr:glycosyltransferase [Lucifera butyrica]VBB05350.1 Hypothetical protein LUCI_0559 [Lucifera butyrica]